MLTEIQTAQNIWPQLAPIIFVPRTESDCQRLFQADTELKYRPAIVLREMPMPYRDLLVCGVSTNLNHYVQGLDDIISPLDVSDYPAEIYRHQSIIPVILSPRT